MMRGDLYLYLYLKNKTAFLLDDSMSDPISNDINKLQHSQMYLFIMTACRLMGTYRVGQKSRQQKIRTHDNVVSFSRAKASGTKDLDSVSV